MAAWREWRRVWVGEALENELGCANRRLGLGGGEKAPPRRKSGRPDRADFALRYGSGRVEARRNRKENSAPGLGYMLRLGDGRPNAPHAGLTERMHSPPGDGAAPT